jgi:hypothetical protein
MSPCSASSQRHRRCSAGDRSGGQALATPAPVMPTNRSNAQSKLNSTRDGEHIRRSPGRSGRPKQGRKDAISDPPDQQLASARYRLANTSRGVSSKRRVLSQTDRRSRDCCTRPCRAKATREPMLTRLFRMSGNGPERRVQRLTTSVAIGEERTWLGPAAGSTRSRMTPNRHQRFKFAVLQKYASHSTMW